MRSQAHQTPLLQTAPAILMSCPGMTSSWTVKDMVFHVGWCRWSEGEGVGVVWSSLPGPCMAKHAAPPRPVLVCLCLSLQPDLQHISCMVARFPAPLPWHQAACPAVCARAWRTQRAAPDSSIQGPQFKQTLFSKLHARNDWGRKLPEL